MTPKEFKEARLRLGMSLSELADALGINRRTVQRYQNGTRPISEKHEKLVLIALSVTKHVPEVLGRVNGSARI